MSLSSSELIQGWIRFLLEEELIVGTPPLLAPSIVPAPISSRRMLLTSASFSSKNSKISSSEVLPKLVETGGKRLGVEDAVERPAECGRNIGSGSSKGRGELKPVSVADTTLPKSATSSKLVYVRDGEDGANATSKLVDVRDGEQETGGEDGDLPNGKSRPSLAAAEGGRNAAIGGVTAASGTTGGGNGRGVTGKTFGEVTSGGPARTSATLASLRSAEPCEASVVKDSMQLLPTLPSFGTDAHDLSDAELEDERGLVCDSDTLGTAAVMLLPLHPIP